jgi:hypothetical protein
VVERTFAWLGRCRRLAKDFEASIQSAVAWTLIAHIRRPRDFSQAAKLVVDIATGQVEDRPPTPEEQGKDPAAAALGRKGGMARAAKMTPERRSEIAREGAKSRWRKD